MDVFLRVRPFLQNEQGPCALTLTDTRCRLRKHIKAPERTYPCTRTTYKFDRCFWSCVTPVSATAFASQGMVTGKMLHHCDLYDRLVNGNGFIVCTCGPVGSGKTYSLWGKSFGGCTPEDKLNKESWAGDMPRCTDAQPFPTTLLGRGSCEAQGDSQISPVYGSLTGLSERSVCTDHEQDDEINLKDDGVGLVPSFLSDLISHEDSSKLDVSVSVVELDQHESYDLCGYGSSSVAEIAMATFHSVRCPRDVVNVLRLANSAHLSRLSSTDSTALSDLVVQVRLHKRDTAATTTGYFVEFAYSHHNPYDGNSPGTQHCGVVTHIPRSLSTLRRAILHDQSDSSCGSSACGRVPTSARRTSKCTTGAASISEGTVRESCWLRFFKQIVSRLYIACLLTVPPGVSSINESIGTLEFSRDVMQLKKSMKFTRTDPKDAIPKKGCSVSSHAAADSLSQDAEQLAKHKLPYIKMLNNPSERLLYRVSKNDLCEIYGTQLVSHDPKCVSSNSSACVFEQRTNNLHTVVPSPTDPCFHSRDKHLDGRAGPPCDYCLPHSAVIPNSRSERRLDGLSHQPQQMRQSPDMPRPGRKLNCARHAQAAEWEVAPSHRKKRGALPGIHCTTSCQRINNVYGTQDTHSKRNRGSEGTRARKKNSSAMQLEAALNHHSHANASHLLPTADGCDSNTANQSNTATKPPTWSHISLMRRGSLRSSSPYPPTRMSNKPVVRTLPAIRFAHRLLTEQQGLLAEELMWRTNVEMEERRMRKAIYMIGRDVQVNRRRSTSPASRTSYSTPRSHRPSRAMS